MNLMHMYSCTVISDKLGEVIAFFYEHHLELLMTAVEPVLNLSYSIIIMHNDDDEK